LNVAIAEAYHAQVEKMHSQAVAHSTHAKATETKPSIPKQLEDGKKWATQENKKSAKVTQGQPDLAPAI
jgi:hypothetical protein